MEKEQKTLIGQATEEQIAEWKKQYGEVWAAVCDGHVAYLKKPSRKALSYASVAGKENPLKFNELLLNDCWIAGSEEIKTNDSLFLGVSAKMAELVEIKEAELGKL